MEQNSISLTPSTVLLRIIISARRIEVPELTRALEGHVSIPSFYRKKLKPREVKGLAQSLTAHKQHSLAFTLQACALYPAPRPAPPRGAGQTRNPDYLLPELRSKQLKTTLGHALSQASLFPVLVFFPFSNSRNSRGCL